MSSDILPHTNEDKHSVRLHLCEIARTGNAQRHQEDSLGHSVWRQGQLSLNGYWLSVCIVKLLDTRHAASLDLTLTHTAEPLKIDKLATLILYSPEHN